MRTCNVCKKKKLGSEFYEKGETGRFLSACKECHNARCLANYRKNLEENRRKRRDYAREHSEETKPKRAVYRLENADRLREYGRKHYYETREQRAEYSKQYKAKNAEEVKRKSAEYRDLNRDKLNAKNRDYYAKNKESIKAKQKATREAEAARIRANEARSRKKNAHKVAARTAKRRTIIARTGGHFTGSEWLMVKEAADFTCLKCGRKEPEIKLSVDHVKAVICGGQNGVDNIQPLCTSCNPSKHAREIDYRTPEFHARLVKLMEKKPCR